MDINEWIIFRRPNPRAKFRLFCFPYMGGGASIYSGWENIISEDIEICAIQLPGREERIDQKPINNKRLLVDKLTKVIKPLNDKPMAFYGHSLGGAICLSVAQELLKSDIRLEHTFVGAHTTLDLQVNRFIKFVGFKKFEKLKKISGETRDEMICSLIKSLQVLPEFLLNDEDMLKSYMSVIRADFSLMEDCISEIRDSYSFELPCPMTAFAGRNDTLYPPNVIEFWNNYNTDIYTVKVKTLEGDHLFINNRKNRRKVIQYIENELLHK